MVREGGPQAIRTHPLKLNEMNPMNASTTPSLDSFGITMQGLEAGLRVQHIAAFDLRTCSPNDLVSEALSACELSDFDQIPVRDDGGHVVGVLIRTKVPCAGKVSDVMCHLDESLLISGEATLISFIRIAGTAPYKLVLNQDGIKGIVTRSDLLKLPVRLLAFAGVTHLETLMFDVIRARFKFGDDAWLNLLKSKRRDKIREKEQKLKRSRMDLDLLELTDFCDKRELVKSAFGLGEDFAEELKQAEHLRNQIAHAATFISSDATARDFAIKLQKNEHWIARLQEIVSVRTQA